MESTFTNASRRYFLERLAIASTVLVASPTILLANNSSKILRFTVLGEDLAFEKIIEKSDKMTLIDDHIVADVIYVSETYQKTLNSIQSVMISGKYLIVEGTENNDLWIEHCRKSGLLLTIIKRSTDASKLFENANYYEGNVTDFQKVITLISFFEQHTKPLNFKTIEQHKPVEMPLA